MTDSIAEAIARMVELVEGIDAIGVVLDHNPRDRKDITEHITADIDGIRVMRAWWVQGPYMTSRWLTRMSPQHVDRTWIYEIHGIEGLTPAFPGDTRGPGEDLVTLRNNGVAVCDAIDADYDLSGSVFDAEPCQWRSPGPQHRTFGPAGGGFGAAHLIIEKRVKHMPART